MKYFLADSTQWFLLSSALGLNLINQIDDHVKVKIDLNERMSFGKTKEKG